MVKGYLKKRYKKKFKRKYKYYFFKKKKKIIKKCKSFKSPISIDLPRNCRFTY